ncbi:MAG TPA: hypothetical protein VLE51_00460 [Candidatus Saccharimonadales bacterium]|nr:hypothetical protein [Candidatus Saccharimonadales bacterium]
MVEKIPVRVEKSSTTALEHSLVSKKEARVAEKQPAIEDIRNKIAHEAVSTDTYEDYDSSPEEEDEQTAEEAFVNKEIKQMAYSRTLSRVRKQMSPTERSMSRLIHLPVVEELSETAAATVGRPSGLIGAGILAFFGSIIYYFTVKQAGYDYDFFVFLVLMAAGFAAGIFIELISRLVRPHH